MTATLRVGVAGTRSDVASVPGLARQVREILVLLRGEARSLQPQTRLVLVCSLAAGVDQFVAEIALEEGYDLEVPLAYPRDEYAEANFSSPEAKTRFANLLSRACAIEELPRQDNPDDAYDAAGSLLVSRSHLLLAIWDFGPGKGPGGTADSVAKAIAAGLVVVKLRSDGTSEAEVVYRGCTGAFGYSAARSILTPCRA